MCDAAEFIHSPVEIALTVEYRDASDCQRYLNGAADT
jgi:hypothetical protein